MTEGPNLCLGCRWLDGGSIAAYQGEPRCAAFPDGIPAEIWAGGDHTAPWPGDHGILFEAAAGLEFVEQAWWESQRMKGAV